VRTEGAHNKQTLLHKRHGFSQKGQEQTERRSAGESNDDDDDRQ
jgi:hypothetical protein